MDYIFKNQFLQLDQRSKSKNFQYYHWAEKKRVEKEKEEYELFRKMWFDIEEQQEKNNKKPKPKIKLEKEQKVNVDPQQLYLKNLQWKQQVDSKIQRKREQKREEQQREFELLKQSKFKEPKMLKQQEHKGPIKAWQERFDNYLRAKGGQDLMGQAQNDFQPKIDKNSRRITKQMVGKVQDRLIEYGQKLKEKKIEMETIYEEELHAQRNNFSISKSFESQISDVYWRLYKDGERMNQKRNEQKSEYSFTPEINQYSMEIASRITQKRTPLYQSKLIASKLEPQNKSVKTKKGSEKGFNDFLRRNEALLSKIQKNRLKKQQNIKEKENKEISQCTFTPQLNPKSLKLFVNQRQNITVNRSNDKIENLSKIDVNQHEDESEHKKLTLVARSQIQPNSYQKQARSTERIERLHSDGNLNIQGQNSNLFIEDTDSISNLHENKRVHKMQSPASVSKHISNKYRSGQSDLFGTDRNQDKRLIENIHEQVEEESIQREKDNDWQKQLNLLEEQIEAMMQRTGY